MRIRTVKPEFWTDSKMVMLPMEARLLYIGLFNLADDSGCFMDDMDTIRMLLFPSDSDMDVSGTVDLLIASGRLERMVSNSGNFFLQIVHFLEHQKIDHPSKSKFPRESSRKLAIPSAVRKAVAIKYKCPPGGSVGAKCYYCGFEGKISWMKLRNGMPSGWIHFSELELDHFISESNKGEAVTENIVLACRGCNRSKADKEPLEFLMKDFASFREDSLKIALEGKGREQGRGKEGEGSTPARADSETPTLDEVKTKASMIGLAEWKAVDWWLRMEGAGWMSGNTRIQKWEPLLYRVKTQWHADGCPKEPPSFAKAKPSTETVFSLRTRMEAKEREAQALKNKHCTGEAFEDWNNQIAKQKYKILRREIGELNQQIAGV